MNFANILKSVKSLTSAQIQELYEALNQNSNDNITANIEESRFSNGIFCPVCGCIKNIKKFGKDAHGKQKYRCKDCGRVFTVTSETVLGKTQKTFSVWQKYIECMRLGLSIRKTAEICNIANSTAFSWRHKILDALSKKRDSEITLKGVVEANETFFAISYKGSKRIPAGYKVRHSGVKSKKRDIFKDKVCVLCAIDRSGNSIAKICNLGRVSVKQLVSFYAGKIENGAIFCTDSERSYIGFTAKNSFKHVRIETGKHKNGVYHINHVNAYCNNIKQFVNKFRGVSTKHLNGYLTWYNTNKLTELETLCELSKTTFTESYKEISQKNPLPLIEEAA